jgi:hypothetical protein
VVIWNATLSHLKLPRVDIGSVKALCVNGTSRVTLLGAQVDRIRGTGIWASGASVLAIHGSAVSSNAAGGVGVSRNATVTIANSIITENKSGGGTGGGLVAGGNATVTISNGSVLSGNIAENASGGGVAAGDNSIVTIANSTITDNESDGYEGGGLVAFGNAIVAISGGSLLSGNAAVNAGGGGLAAFENTTVTIDNSTIKDNESTGIGGGGGLVAGGNATVTVSDQSVLSGNHALTAYGGGVAAWDNSTVSISNSTITENISDGYSGGGLVVAGNATVTISRGSVLSNNVAVNGSGGGLAASGNSAVTIDNSTITGNTIDDGYSGGGLYASGNATVTISGGSVLSSNHALDGGGGGLAAVDHSAVTIANSTITNNTCYGNSGGGLYADENATVAISDGSVLSGNVAFNGAGGGLAALNGATVTIDNSTITDNWSNGYSGGGLYAGGNATVTISDVSVLSGNVAMSASGGGLAAGDSATVTMKNTTCHSNEAIGGGGGCVSVLAKSFVSIMQGVLANNTSSYSQGGGAVFGRENARILLDQNTLIVGNGALNGSSGGGISVLGESSVLITGGSLISDNRADLEGGGVYVVDHATVNVTGNVKYTNNTSKYSGSDVRAGGDGNLVLGETNINIRSKTVSWTRTQCITGEIPLSGLCQACPTGTYNVDSSVKSCLVCPDNADCSGGDQISPKAGYWYSSKHSAQIHKCLSSSSCLDKGVCSEGYLGNLCGSCDSGYGDTVPFQCEQCMPKWKTAPLYLSGWVAMFLLVSWTVHTTLGDSASAGVGRPSDYLKVLVRHLQYLLVVASLPTPWPDALSAMFKALGWLFAASSGQAVSLSCLLSDTSSDLPLPIQKALLYLMAPLVMLVLVLVSRVLRRCLPALLRKGKEGRHHVKYTLWGEVVCSSLVVLFFFYPTQVRVGLGMFACIPLDSPSSSDIHDIANATHGYWVPDLQQACYEGWHKPWALGLGIPITLLFCLCVPVGIWVLLKVNKPKLYLHSFLAIGFLSHNYRSTRYYWEAISTAQLAVVVTVSVFRFNLGAYYATVLLNASYTLFFTMQYMYSPAAVRRLELMQMVSFATLSFTTYIALTAFTVGEVAAPPLYSSIVGVFGLLVNVAFALWCCFEIVSAGSGVLKALVEKMYACLGITAHRNRAVQGFAAASEGVV